MGDQVRLEAWATREQTSRHLRRITDQEIAEATVGRLRHASPNLGPVGARSSVRSGWACEGQRRNDPGITVAVSAANMMSKGNISLPARAAASEPDLICLSHLRWNFVFQRPQHLMSRYAIARRV